MNGVAQNDVALVVTRVYTHGVRGLGVLVLNAAHLIATASSSAESGCCPTGLPLPYLDFKALGAIIPTKPT